jgi:C-terminal processing protease CtpA/Prc
MKITRIVISVAIVLAAVAIVSLAAETGGTGVWIFDRSNQNEPLTTGQVLPKSPAGRAGIKPGWFLISVDGTNAVNMAATNAVSMIRDPAGTLVTLELADPTRSKTNKFTLKRGRVVFQNKSIVEIADP